MADFNFEQNAKNGKRKRLVRRDNQLVIRCPDCGGTDCRKVDSITMEHSIPSYHVTRPCLKKIQDYLCECNDCGWRFGVEINWCKDRQEGWKK